MRILVAEKFFQYFTKKGTRAIALYPFVLLRNRKDLGNQRIRNHEAIHLQQQKETLVVLFYVVYLIEFIYFLTCCKNWEMAYRSISFEREAYEHQNDFNYLKNRKTFAMWRK